MIQMHENDISDEAIGIEVEVEVDIGGWDMQWPKIWIAPD